MQPYDYTLNAQSPLQSFNSAYTMGSVIKQQQDAARLAEAQRAQAEAEAKRQEQVNAMFENLKRPGATARDYANLAMVMPKDASASILNSLEALNEAERAAALKDTGEVFSLFVSGNTDLAIKRLRMHAEAERASGNEEEAKKLEYYANQAEMGEDQSESIQHAIGYSMTAMPGGKDVVDTILKYNEDRRKAIEHPILVEQKNAELDKAKSEADKARVEANYAEKLKIAELEDKAAELGLTKEKTNETIAQTKKLNAEIAKALMELKALEASGGIDPEKKFEQESKIRGEYQKRVASYNELTETYDRIKSSAGDTSGAGDVALVNGFMRMLDPGSVVRESEFATARDTAGLYGTLEAVMTKVKNGQFLTPKQREDFASLAGKYMDSSRKHEEKVRKDLGVVVRNYGLSSDNVFGISNQNADIQELRDFLKKNNKGREKDIDSMSEDQLAKSFPNGYNTYREEVDL